MGAGDVFVERRGDRHVLVVAPAFEASAVALGLHEAAGVERALAATRGGGRHTAVLPLPDRSERLHLRRVRRRGWLSGLLGDLGLGVERPRAELRVTAALSEAGAPVPAPVLVVGRRGAWPVWTTAVGTVFCDGSRNGLEFLESLPERARLLGVAAAAGAAVRRFHDAGGRHADLHAGNLLVCGADTDARVLVADLDRARVGDRPDAPRRMRELMRLYRSLLKRERLATVGVRGLARFFGAYTGGDRALRRALLSHLPRERRRVARHALLYGARVRNGARLSSRARPDPGPGFGTRGRPIGSAPRRPEREGSSSP